jgi:2,5-diamino-6-(ribosylamino)-4(3H)-pyrimidinone 5'-phosphate reductase
VHNSVSLDGSLTNFEPNMGLHYKIAANYMPDAHLIGSGTAVSGLKMFNVQIPNEEKTDFEKPQRDASLPYWVIVDSNGALMGALHVCRRFQYSKDVIVLISEETTPEYVSYLKQRNYDYIITGKSKVDLKAALQILAAKYAIKTVLTDTGQILINLLLSQGLVSEISLLIHPVLVGKEAYPIFRNVVYPKLTLLKCELLEKEYVWAVYGVEK